MNSVCACVRACVCGLKGAQIGTHAHAHTQVMRAMQDRCEVEGGLCVVVGVGGPWWWSPARRRTGRSPMTLGGEAKR